MTPSSFCDQLVLFYCLSSNRTCGEPSQKPGPPLVKSGPRATRDGTFSLNLGQTGSGPSFRWSQEYPGFSGQRRDFFLLWLLPQQLGRKPEQEQGKENIHVSEQGVGSTRSMASLLFGQDRSRTQAGSSVKPSGAPTKAACLPGAVTFEPGTKDCSLFGDKKVMLLYN